MKYTISALAVVCLAGGAFAQSFADGFEGATASPAGASGTVTSVVTWDWLNESVGGPGTVSWNIQTNATPPPFTTPFGVDYLSVNFNSSTGSNDISNWLMSPERLFNNGDTISFYTRTVTANSFPDRLNLKLSTNGSSTNTADFTTTLLTINPNLQTGAANYPEDWTQFSATLSGLNGPTSGRFAFHYDPTNGGPLGNNSNYIGIDDVSYQAVPEPATMIALGLGAAAAAARRRRK